MRGLLLLSLLPLAADVVPAPPQIRLDGDAARIRVEAQLPGDALKDLPDGRWSQDLGETWLRFSLVKKEGIGQPLLGSYERRGELLIFRPRFGARARGTLSGLLRKRRVRKITDGRVSCPRRRPATPQALVEKVLPASDILPANHLRFYIWFSEPMRGGAEIFDQICILDADGKEVASPWLRDELWDEKSKKLILYIHPGRIKWGLVLRETLGPVLEPNKEYSLVIKGAMLDAQGQKLGKDHVKKFRTTGEERTRISLADWKIQAPAAGSTRILKVDFPRVLDHVQPRTLSHGQGRQEAGSAGNDSLLARRRNRGRFSQRPRGRPRNTRCTSMRSWRTRPETRRCGRLTWI